MKRLLVVLCFALVFLSFPSSVQAKDYFFPKVKIGVTINSDRSFDVVEQRTYSFSGSFSWATLFIPTKIIRQGNVYKVTIADFAVYEKTPLGEIEPLGFTSSDEDGKFNVRWNYAAVNEEKTFIFSYHVSGEGVKKYTDAAEFYWQVIGDGWDKKARNVEVLVNIPEGASKEEIKVFGHGPLTGTSEIINAQQLRFTVSQLPPNTFVEVRVLFPPKLLDGPPSSEKNLETILAEEENFRQDTIRQIERQQLIKRLLTIFLIFFIFIFQPLILISWFYFYYKTWKRVGDDYDFPDIPKYIKEPPSDLSPALVDNLLKEGDSVSTKAFVATIFDLARRGYINIRDEGKVKSGFLRVRTEYKTTLIKNPKGDEKSLNPHEKKILDYIFKTIGNHRDEVTFKEIKDYIKSHYRFKSWFDRWQKDVARSGKGLGFMEVEGNKQTKRFWIISTLLILVGSPVILLGIFLIPLLKRRSYKWAKQTEEWKAFDRYLDDFAKFKELPPEAYKLWEVYLTFGVLFGNAEKIIKMLPVILQDERAVQAVWYTSSTYTGLVGSTEGLSNLSSSLSNLTSAFTSISASSISTGSGGGFSSGGGGGGGGGGGSAG